LAGRSGISRIRMATCPRPGSTNTPGVYRGNALALDNRLPRAVASDPDWVPWGSWTPNFPLEYASRNPGRLFTVDSRRGLVVVRSPTCCRRGARCGSQAGSWRFAVRISAASSQTNQDLHGAVRSFRTPSASNLRYTAHQPYDARQPTFEAP